MKTKTLYKSIPENKTSHGHKFKLNKWEKVEDISICRRGFHASKNVIDAMGYVSAGYIAEVEVRGESIIENDKGCWSEMRIVRWEKWTKKDSMSLAIYAAELVLNNFEKKYPNDKRPREAIESAKRVLKNDNAKNRSAARSAARSAESAAWSAESAARSAARSAERSAESAAWSAEGAESAAWSAESAAWSAARSARSAARSAAWSAESAKYKKILKKCHDFVIERKDL